MADHEYIERRLEAMGDEALINIKKAITQVRSKYDPNNSRTHFVYHETAAEKLREALKEMATFTYNACDGTSEDAAQALHRAGEKVGGGLIDHLLDLSETSRGSYAGPVGWAAKLRDIIGHAVDDFRHGIVGVSRLKKDPFVNVVSNITNSPGAAQQTVVGDHNQQSIQQQNSELITIVDQILASDEFKSLSEANRDAVQDTAEALRGEIAKQAPDQSRIRRWAERLLAFAKEFGMHMAATALTKLLMAWPALNAIVQHPPV